MDAGRRAPKGPGRSDVNQTKHNVAEIARDYAAVS